VDTETYGEWLTECETTLAAERALSDALAEALRGVMEGDFPPPEAYRAGRKALSDYRAARGAA